VSDGPRRHFTGYSDRGSVCIAGGAVTSRWSAVCLGWMGVIAEPWRNKKRAPQLVLSVLHGDLPGFVQSLGLYIARSHSLYHGESTERRTKARRDLPRQARLTPGDFTQNPERIILLQSPDARLLPLPHPLPNLRQFLKDPNLIWDRYDGMHMLRHISPFTKHDNATASLHRLCELICAASPNQIKLETVYFWCHSSWTL
jgi:hypothetical protein